MRNLKQIINTQGTNPSGLSDFVTELANDVEGRRLVPDGMNVSTEAMSDLERDAVTGTAQELAASIEAITVRLGVENSASEAHRTAAVLGGLIASDPLTFLSRKPTPAVSNSEHTHVIHNIGVEDTHETRQLGLEVYDERENQQATVYSVAYNLHAARQDDFGEAFYPTITCSPDEVGFAIEVELTMVYSDIARSTSGKIDNFNKKNVLRAFADPDILKNELTRLVPVFRTGTNDAHFIDQDYVAASNFNLEGTSILNAPLLPGARMSLLGISQTNAQLAKGTADQTDSIDPAVTLEYVYIRIGAHDGTGAPAGQNNAILRFAVEDLPRSNFAYSTQGGYRGMSLNFSSTSLIVKRTAVVGGQQQTTVFPSGTAADETNTTLSSWDGTATNPDMLRLSITMTGELDLETSELVVWGNEISVDTIRDGAGNLIALDSTEGATLLGEFAGSAIVGYKLKAFATNSNRRNRGQLLDTIRETHLYNVPIRNSISAIHPVGGRYDNDTSDLAALISHTRARCSNAAVETLIRASGILQNFQDTNTGALDDNNGQYPDVLGVGRYLVKPSYFSETINVDTTVDSRTSSERAADVQAVLVNKIRDYAYEMYRDSEYWPASEATNGGTHRRPTVIVGTDPVIARYLTVTGDLRTLGSEFDVKVVSTLDKRIKGKIFITFGIFDAKRNTAPNPLNFGQMAWSPEVTVVLPVSRGGQVSKELSVAPRFLHVTNLPVLTELSVLGIGSALNKVTLNVSQ